MSNWGKPSEATPVEEWALAQHNRTDYKRTVMVRLPSAYGDYGPSVLVRLGTAYTNTPDSSLQARLSSEQARAMATMLLYAADRADREAAQEGGEEPL